MISGKFVPLNTLNPDDTDLDTLASDFNVAVTETTEATLGKHRPKKEAMGHR